MKNIKSDIEIARKAKMKPIKNILAKINVPDNDECLTVFNKAVIKNKYIKYLIELPKNQLSDYSFKINHNDLHCCLIDLKFYNLYLETREKLLAHIAVLIRLNCGGCITLAFVVLTTYILSVAFLNA